MARPTMRERVIRFYEVVVVESGEQRRVTQLDTGQALAQLGLAPVEHRRWDHDRTYVGTTKTVDDEDHLLLHRVRDRGEWLSVMDLATGNWQELESRAHEGYLDTSAITFLPYGNVVAVMQGSTSAPSHRSLEGWLNHLQLFGSAQFAVRPLVTRAETDRLRTASGASRIEIRIGSSKMAGLRQKTGRLARFLRRASEDYGDLDVTVTISVPRGGARDDDRRRLLEDLQDIDDVIPGAAEKAKARLVFSDPGSEDYARLTELIEHHITAKRRVPAVDDQGNSIRLNAAIQVMVGAAAEHEDELRLASDADSTP